MADLQIPETEHYREAIDSVRKRVPVPRNVWDDMQVEEREHAFTVTQVARVDVLQDVLDAVDKAVETGTSIDDFRAAVADKLIEQWGGSEIPGRIETIFRTNIQVAYAEGRHAINSAPAVKEARPYWRYDDTDNDRECDLCHECHGVILPADAPFWVTHHPPLHHQCECTITALSSEEAEEEGLTTPEEIPDVEADEGFGNQPTSEGRDWAPDLESYDPDLRDALEKKLAEFEGREPREWPKAPEIEPERAPARELPKVAEPEPQPEPKPIPDVYFEGGHIEDVAKKLMEHDQAHVLEKKEHGLAVNQWGDTLFSKRGKKAEVAFTKEEWERLKDKDVIFTHNHPSGGSLSTADYQCADKANMLEVRAVGVNKFSGETWSYSFHRPPDGWPETTLVSRYHGIFRRELREELLDAMRAGRISAEEANASFGHAIWERVQGIIDIGYKARKIK